MEPALRIRDYEPGDEDALVEAWNRSLRYDPITLRVFERKVLLDPNFESSGLKIAEVGGELAGFVIGIVRRYPLFYQGLEAERGWITSIAVRPEFDLQEVAHRLLEEIFKFFMERGRVYVWFSPYTPNYFFPGVDPDRYGWVLETLETHGFKRVYEAISMDAQLYPDYEVPDWVYEAERGLEEQGIEIRHLETKDIHPLLRFLERNFSADWYRHCLELLQRGCGKDQVLVAVRDGEVLGYCQYFHGEEYDWHRAGAHFGPFGVREDFRGRGIGSVLLAKCLREMRAKGFHNAFLLWTDRETARFYSKFGFRITRKFYIMRRALR